MNTEEFVNADFPELRSESKPETEIITKLKEKIKALQEENARLRSVIVEASKERYGVL